MLFRSAEKAVAGVEQPTDQAVDAGIARADLPGKVASAVAAQPTVVAAAAAAVDAARSHLAFSVIFGPQSTPVTLAAIRGTPIYGAPSKFGSAQSGGVTKAVGAIPDAPMITLDGWFRQAALPTGTAVDIVWSINGFMYVCIEATTGYLSYVHGGASKRISTTNVCEIGRASCRDRVF